MVDKLVKLPKFALTRSVENVKEKLALDIAQEFGKELPRKEICKTSELKFGEQVRIVNADSSIRRPHFLGWQIKYLSTKISK